VTVPLRIGLFWALFVASVKMFVRNRVALFFSLFLPLVIMVIFGVLNFGAGTTVELGVVDEAHNPASGKLIAALEAFDSFKLTQGTHADEIGELEKGHRAVVLTIPDGYELAPGGTQLLAETSTAQAQQAQIGALLLNQAASQAMFGQAGGGTTPPVRVEQVNARDLGYIDFLVPGVLGLTIMNLGLFGVAFGFVQLKRTGTLRRLFATPTPPGYFLAAQVASRLVLGMIQVLILLGIGLLFGLHLIGSVALVLLVALLGAVIFLAMGFAIAGWAKNEDQAAPVANLVSLPMLFLSGTFFSRDAMPDVLASITSYLPLTYLNDALRRIANDGAGLGDLGGDLLGMAIWAAIAFVVAVRLFRWE
jgi:ABC-2 type transport system permease protein